jgi:hypothetical protein
VVFPATLPWIVIGPTVAANTIAALARSLMLDLCPPDIFWMSTWIRDFFGIDTLLLLIDRHCPGYRARKSTFLNDPTKKGGEMVCLGEVLHYRMSTRQG